MGKADLHPLSKSEAKNGQRPTFGGHEKFVFRHGWLKKGVDAVSSDPLIFTRADSLVTLGVGKNMVRAIRHWCLATGLVSELKSARRKPWPLIPTPLGERLMLEGGWDPYLEDPGSLWLLHWQLIANQERCLVWYLAFSAYLEEEFSKRSLAAYLGRHFDRSGIHTTTSMIDREVDCYLRTYVPARQRRDTFSEESFDCPLADLELVHHTPEDNIYRFIIGPKNSLPTAVFGYALLNYVSQTARTRRTIAVEECVYQNGSPGQAFKLDENSIVQHLEALETLSAGRLRLHDTAGLRQILLDETIAERAEDSAFELLQNYYGRA